MPYYPNFQTTFANPEELSLFNQWKMQNQFSQFQQHQQQQQQPPQSDQQSFHLVDETEDENKEEPIPTLTSKKTSRGLRLKSKATKNKEKETQVDVIEQESEERRQLIHSQRITEEMKVLQIDIRGMDPADAVIINAQKARIRAAYLPPPPPPN
nr:hypothetical protein [Tanacetum cinerariifolium]